MSEPNDLATLLDNAQSAPSQPIETKQEAAPEPLKTEPAEVSAPGDKQEAAPPAVSDEGEDASGMVPKKVALDERRKRQELERQLAELTKQRTAPQAPQQAQPQQPQTQLDLAQGLPERPDPWIDPQGAMDWDRALLQRQMDQSVYETRATISREMMLQSKPDFEEIENLFFQALPQMPHLGPQIRRHPMPAKFAYEMGVKIKAMMEIGDDPAAYKQRVREELEAELRGQSSSQPAQSQAPKASTPKSLAATPSAQPRDDRGRFQGPASLESILGG